jgi:hypothetical protein
VKGEFYPSWNPDGSVRWPWLSRTVHDWESPNGVVTQNLRAGFAPYPDEQPNFMHDKEEENKEDEENAEDLDE